LLLLAIAVALTQIILWTSIPRDVALSKLQTQLGLRIQARSLSAGWLTTTLHDVQISLPLAEQSVVVVPEMRVRHNWLPLLLLRGPDLKSVELDRPVLNVWQSTDGQWNIAEVMELLGRSGGKNTDTARSATPSSPPRLPNLVISDATVNVATAGGKKQQIGHVEIRGQAQGPLVWEYDVSVAGRISLVGKVAPGDTWSHQVTLNVKPQAVDLLRPWMANVPAFELTNGKWTGRIDNGGLAGRLDIGVLKFNGLVASGALNASNQNGTIQLLPVNLAVETGQPLVPRVVATGGSLTYDGKNVVANGVQATLAGGQLRIDASVDTSVSGGKLSMLWEGLTLSPGGAAGGPRTSGSLDASFATRLAGRPEIRASLNTRGWLSATRNWDGKLQINGDGSSWQNIDWGITASSFTLTGQQIVMLNGLSVALHMDQTELALTNIALPDSAAGSGAAVFPGAVANANSRLAVSEMIAAASAVPTTAPITPVVSTGTTNTAATSSIRPRATSLRTLNGGGDYNFATQAWWLKLSGRGWPAPQIEDETLAFNVDVQGNRDLLKLNDMSFYLAGAVVRLDGTYVYAEPAPVHMQLDIAHQQAAPQKNSLQAERVQAVAAVTGVPPPAVPDAALINGEIDGTVKLTGKMKDGVDLEIKGKLTGRNVRFRGHKIGDFDGVIDGKADDTLAKVYTDKFDLLGAKWGLSAFYQFDKGATTITLSVDHLRAEDPRLQELLQRDDLAGDFNGQWTLYMPGIKSRSQRMGGTGWLEGRALLTPSLAASHFHANFLLKDDTLTIDPIELRRPAVEIAGNVLPNSVKAALASATAPAEPDSATPATADGEGQIRFGVSMNLAKPDHITVSKLSVVNWPFPMPAAGAVLSFNGSSESIAIDLPDDAAKPGSAGSLFHLNSRSLNLGVSILAVLANGKTAKVGDGDLVVQLDDRVADVRDVRVNLLGATLTANALLDLDHPLLASARLWVQNVDFKQIAQVVPAVNRVQGQYDLTVAVAPATSPNSLEPLQIDVSLHSVGARVGGMALGDGRLRAYANVDPDWGLVRLVSQDQSPNSPAPSPDHCPPKRIDPSMPNQNTIEIAGGMLAVWARFVRNENAAGYAGATSLSSQIWLGFQCLDLNQLAHIVDVESPTMPGKLDGTISLYGTTGIKMPRGKGVTPGTDPLAQASAHTAVQDTFLVRLGRSLYGDGNVALTDADIGNFGPIAFLYNAMHIGNDKRGPTGTGGVAFRVEGGSLVVTALHYFNRGVEVRAQARVDNLAIIPDSPLSGTAVGLARPLKNLKLPILSSLLPDVDSFLSALQGSAVSERIGGTLHAPKMSLILFGDIGAGLRDLLVGDAQAQHAAGE